MDYAITQDDVNQLIQLHNRLGMIEVKGDSVEHLFSCRLLVKKIVEDLKELKEEKLEVIKEEE